MNRFTPTPQLTRTFLGAALALALVALSACGGHDRGAARGTYVGSIPGSNAYIGIVSNGKQATGYVCDDGHLAVWLRPTAVNPDGTVQLVAKSGRTVGSARLVDGRATGVVGIAAVQRRFAADPARGTAGIYRLQRGSRVSGWIVLGDKSQRGVDMLVAPNVVSTAPRLTLRSTGASIAGTSLQPTRMQPLDVTQNTNTAGAPD